MIHLIRTEDNPDLPLPEYATVEASGMDIRSNEETYIMPGEAKTIRTGFKVGYMTWGYELQVRPRSGMAMKNRVTVLNSPGTIDSDYRGEIKILLINHSDEAFYIYRGDRVAQLVYSKVYQPTIQEVLEPQESERGEGGFGSTGKE